MTRLAGPPAARATQGTALGAPAWRQEGGRNGLRGKPSVLAQRSTASPTSKKLFELAALHLPIERGWLKRISVTVTPLSPLHTSKDQIRWAVHVSVLSSSAETEL